MYTTMICMRSSTKQVPRRLLWHVRAGVLAAAQARLCSTLWYTHMPPPTARPQASHGAGENQRRRALPAALCRHRGAHALPAGGPPQAALHARHGRAGLPSLVRRVGLCWGRVGWSGVGWGGWQREPSCWPCSMACWHAGLGGCRWQGCAGSGRGWARPLDSATQQQPAARLHRPRSRPPHPPSRPPQTTPCPAPPQVLALHRVVPLPGVERHVHGVPGGQPHRGRFAPRDHSLPGQEALWGPAAGRAGARVPLLAGGGSAAGGSRGGEGAAAAAERRLGA